MKYREEITGFFFLLRNLLQGKSIIRFYYLGVKWRKCCIVVSYVVIQLIIEYISSNSRYLSNDKLLILNFVSKICVIFVIVDDNRSIRIFDKINDNNALENFSSALLYRNGRRMNLFVVLISFCTLMELRRVKIFRRILLSMTRNTVVIINTSIIVETRSISSVNVVRRVNQLLFIRISLMSLICVIRLRSVFSDFVFWKSSFGIIIVIVGSGFFFSIFSVLLKLDQLRNLFSAFLRERQFIFFTFCSVCNCVITFVVALSFSVFCR